MDSAQFAAFSRQAELQNKEVIAELKLMNKQLCIIQNTLKLKQLKVDE